MAGPFQTFRDKVENFVVGRDRISTFLFEAGVKKLWNFLFCKLILTLKWGKKYGGLSKAFNEKIKFSSRNIARYSVHKSKE